MRRLVVLAALFLAHWSAAETATLTILYTSDLHGHLIFNSENLRSTNTRMVLSNGTLDPIFDVESTAGSPRQYQAGLKFRF